MGEIEGIGDAILRCGLGEDILAISIWVTDHEGRRLHCWLDVDATESRQSLVHMPISIFGHELKTFVKGLQQLYDSILGSVSLHDCDNAEIVCLSGDDRNRGHVAIGVHARVASCRDERLSSARFMDAPGLMIALEGGQTDQTCLLPFIRGLAEVLNAPGVDVSDPYPPSMFE